MFLVEEHRNKMHDYTYIWFLLSILLSTVVGEWQWINISTYAYREYKISSIVSFAALYIIDE